MEGATTQALADFVSGTGFDNLPKEVIHETKRILLDIIGCALGSKDLDKGKIAIEFARRIGGRPEATILGTAEKTTAGLAAFTNGELMHTTDHCPLLPPSHISAFVTPAPLALAEANNTSGKTLIAAVAIAHEVASRVGLSLDPMRIKKGGLVARSWGLGFNEFGATAGAAKVLGLGGTSMIDAIGLAGYYAPVPSHNKFLNTPQGGGMAKYGPAGWTAQGGVTAAILASMGYQGDRSVLDGDYGFWAMTGSKGSNVGNITNGLGTQWNILRVMYKRWPCAGLFQAPIGAFSKVVADNDLKPNEIEHVLVKNEEQGGLPRFQYTEIQHNVDTQNNLPYNIALAAHRVKVSSAWQNWHNIDNPSVRALMKKITIEPYPRAEETRHQELVVERRPYIERRPCFVQVTARGQQFTQTVEYGYWLSIDDTDHRASDGDLAEKFRANAVDALAPAKIDRAIEKIMNLEALADTAELVKELIP